MARTDLARAEEHRDAVLQHADRFQQDLLAFRHQLAERDRELEQTTTELDLTRSDLARTQEDRDTVLQRLRHRAPQACALLLCLGSVGGFAAGLGGANWQQANSGAPTPLVSEVPRR